LFQINNLIKKLFLIIAITSTQTLAEEKVYRCNGHVISLGVELDPISCIIKVNDMNNVYKNTFIHSCLSGNESKTEYMELNDPRMISHSSVSISSNMVHVKHEHKFPNKESSDTNEFIDFDQISKKYSGIAKSPWGIHKFYGICN
jgi:hypothetical protein